MKYLFVGADGTCSQKELPSDQFTQEQLADVDNGDLDIFRFDPRKSQFERLAVESEEKEGEVEEGVEPETQIEYSVGDWLVV